MKLDYWQWPGYLNTEKIKDINKIIASSSLEDEPVKLAATNIGATPKKFLKTKLIPFSVIHQFFPDLWDRITVTNLEHFGYDIVPINPVADSVHYNLYSSKTKDEYHWHIDGTDTPLVDLKFTILINISDSSYRGGDFKLFNNNEYKVPELDVPGNMIMFKSFLNHKVEKVTAGERKTLCLFIKGPAFK